MLRETTLRSIKPTENLERGSRKKITKISSKVSSCKKKKKTTTKKRKKKKNMVLKNDKNKYFSLCFINKDIYIIDVKIFISYLYHTIISSA